MSADPIDLATLADAKLWLGITNNQSDPLLQQLLTAASDWIQTQLSRNIKVTTYTDEFYDGPGKNWMPLRNWPIVSISAIKIRSGSSVTTYSASGTDFEFSEDTIYFLGGNKAFPQGRGNVKVTYVAGYAVVPPALARATVDLMSTIYRGKDFIGYQSKSLAGETVSFSFTKIPSSVDRIIIQLQRVI